MDEKGITANVPEPKKNRAELGVIYLNSAYREAKATFWPNEGDKVMLRLETESGICANIELSEEARKYLVREAERRNA